MAAEGWVKDEGLPQSRVPLGSLCSAERLRVPSDLGPSKDPTAAALSEALLTDVKPLTLKKANVPTLFLWGPHVSRDSILLRQRFKMTHPSGPPDNESTGNKLFFSKKIETEFRPLLY